MAAAYIVDRLEVAQHENTYVAVDRKRPFFNLLRDLRALPGVPPRNGIEPEVAREASELVKLRGAAAGKACNFRAFAGHKALFPAARTAEKNPLQAVGAERFVHADVIFALPLEVVERELFV